MLHYDELAVIESNGSTTAQLLRRQYLESLVHATKNHEAPYKKFDDEFYKFPSYLRREAITTAIGNIMSYKSMVRNWEENGQKGRRPFLNRNQCVMPCFYNSDMFKKDGRNVKIKLYNGHDWVWYSMEIRNTDFMYALKNVYDWKESAPVLAKCHGGYELRIAYTKANSTFPKYEKDKDVNIVLGVDLGINTDAVCSVVHKDGTVTGNKFIDSPVEKDRMYRLLNVVKKAQQHGSRKNRRLWRFINNYNEAIAIKTASEIIEFALKSKAQVIVFEYLKMNGKKRGSKKQRISLWRKRDIQKRVEAMGARCGIRVAYVCAVNTSRLAYDGSGKVTRGLDAGFKNNQLCRFSNGKVYNCDLSASKNIGARYFIRVLLKSVSAKKLSSVLAKVPELGVRTKCVLATLISFNAVLCTMKASGSAAPASAHAA